MKPVRNIELVGESKQLVERQRLPLSPTTQRIADGAAAVRNALPGEEEIAYFHSVLTQVSLPRRRMTERVFERTSGHVSFHLNAGALWKPSTQQWVEQPLPFGPIPR